MSTKPRIFDETGSNNTADGVQAFIPDMDDNQLRQLAREKLSEALQAVDPRSQPEMTRKLCAEVKDRLDGKAAQAMTLDATVRNITVNATIRFANTTASQVIEHDPRTISGSTDI